MSVNARTCEAPQELKSLAGTAKETLKANKGDSKSDMSSTAESWDGPEPPAVFVCPISLQLMENPAVLLETGQVFERDAVTEWLKVKRTCPTTGVQLTDVETVPVHGLRRAIYDWSERNEDSKVENNERDDAGKNSPFFKVGITTPKQMYNIGHLCTTVGECGDKTKDGRRAMGLLNEMLSKGFVEESAIRTRLPQISMLNSRVDDFGGMDESEAKLRFRLFGERMVWREKILMLRCKGLDLVRQILSWFAGWAQNKRRRLSATGKILGGLRDIELERLRDSLIEIACPLRSDAHSKARDGAALVLGALLFDSKTRYHFTSACVGGALLRYCSSNTDPRIQFCAVKGIQKMCATEKGRRIICASNDLGSIVALLPSADSTSAYSTRVFSGLFTRTTVVETLVKLLHSVAAEPEGVEGLIDCGAIPALNEVCWSLKLDYSFEKRYLDPLLEKLLRGLASRRMSGDGLTHSSTSYQNFAQG
ncbi:hypothetical protein BSKO_09864 [Bryopsis sp. KO-2023]|nr:hypothetical protein BSKO_09864 [Bryopsis sp. KO-2023]